MFQHDQVISSLPIRRDKTVQGVCKLLKAGHLVLALSRGLLLKLYTCLNHWYRSHHSLSFQCFLLWVRWYHNLPILRCCLLSDRLGEWWHLSGILKHPMCTGCCQTALMNHMAQPSCLQFNHCCWSTIDCQCGLCWSVVPGPNFIELLNGRFCA